MRAWRAERNWSGQQTASAVSTELGRTIAWPELRSYETGEAAPDTATATAIARAFHRSLTDLAFGAPSRTVPQQALGSRDEAAIAAELSARGADPALAAEFAKHGQTAGSTKAWLRAFEAPDALAWIESGFKPVESSNLAKLGIAPKVARISLHAGDVEAARQIQTLIDRGHPMEAAAKWAGEDLDVDLADEWASVGWDLMAAIPWLRAGYEPIIATRWRGSGFTASESSELCPEMGPEHASLWRTTRIPLEEWTRWAESGFTHQDAGAWAEAEFGPEVAQGWALGGFSASDARTLVDEGLSAQTGSDWVSAGLAAPSVRHWIDYGIEPQQARAWTALGCTAEEARRQIDKGETPAALERWIGASFSISESAAWRSNGFSLRRALEWRGFRPDRASRLRERGVSAHRAQARQDEGARRLEEARTHRGHQSVVFDPYEAGEGPRAVHAQSVQTCGACGVPISLNGRCRCA